MANKEVVLHASNYCGLLCISVQMHPDMLFTCAFSFLPSFCPFHSYEWQHTW